MAILKKLLFSIPLNYFSIDHLFNVHSEDLQIFVKFSDGSRTKMLALLTGHWNIIICIHLGRYHIGMRYSETIYWVI